MRAKGTKTSRFLQQWNDGDHRGLDSLLECHLSWIHARVRKRIGPLLRGKGVTADYVQDAIVDFLKYGPRISISNDADFRALIAKIVENSLRHKYEWMKAKRRDVARERPLPSDTVLILDQPKESVRTPSQSAEHHEEEAWIRLGMELLDPEFYEVLALRNWDGLSFNEIGVRIGVSANSARMKHRRAVCMLSRYLWDLRSGNLNRIVAE